LVCIFFLFSTFLTVLAAFIEPSNISSLSESLVSLASGRTVSSSMWQASSFGSLFMSRVGETGIYVCFKPCEIHIYTY
jgi:hypothetical protein